jgi:hypothetical protein
VVITFGLVPKTDPPPIHLGGLDLLIALALALITFLIFSRAAKNDFMFVDDWEYVVQNPHVQTGLTPESLWWALTTFDCANWHPLTWISLETDCQLFGGGPASLHLVNAAIHAINTSLLFAVLLLATFRRWPSFFCATLWGWHPLRVESVAWIAERKDVLSMLFFLLTVLAYVRYSQRPSVVGYCLVLVSLLLGLLTKPMLVMTPALLLLLDYWPLKRWSDGASFRLLLLEKIPLTLLSIASGIVTIFAQRAGGAVIELRDFGLYRRLNNSACSVVAYIAKSLFPHKLAPYYPFPDHQPLWRFAGAIALLLLITFVCLRARRTRPYLIVGWLWFIVSLLPVIGLLQVGAQSMADRYTYLPGIGLLIALVWQASDWCERQQTVRLLVIAAGVCAALALVPMTYHQIALWKDDVTLFTYTSSVTRPNWFAEGILANVLADQGDLDDAETHARKSLSILPHYAPNLDTLASIQRLRRQRLPGEAEFAREAIENPSDPMVHYRWADLLLRNERVRGAVFQYRLYLAARPNDAEAHAKLGTAYLRGGYLTTASHEFDRSIELDPHCAAGYCGMGTILLRKGNTSEAQAYFQRALQFDPDLRAARIGLQQCRGS